MSHEGEPINPETPMSPEAHIASLEARVASLEAALDTIRTNQETLMAQNKEILAGLGNTAVAGSEAQSSANVEPIVPVAKKDDAAKAPVAARTPRAETPEPPEKGFFSRNKAKIAAVGAVALAAVFIGNPFNSDKKNSDRVASDAPAAEMNSGSTRSLLDALKSFNKGVASADAQTSGEDGSTTESESTTGTSTKTAREKMLDRIENAEEATTVAFAVKRANPTHKNVKFMIKSMADGENKMKIDNQKDAWGSLNDAIALKNLSSPEAALGLALNAEANKDIAIATANLLNHKDPMTASNMTHEQALDSIVEDLTKSDTDLSRGIKSGLQNHGYDGKNVYRAGISENIPTLIVNVDGKDESFKLVCLNGQYKLEKVTPMTPNTPPSTPNTNNPTPPTGGPENPDSPKPPSDGPRTPGNPTTPSDRPEQPKTPENPTKTPPKNNSSEKPGGNDGQDGGDPAGAALPARPEAGPAPAGVGQPQEQKPAPIVSAPETRPPEAPAVTGVDPGTTAPAPQGGPGTTAPAGQVNPNNQPTGE